MALALPLPPLPRPALIDTAMSMVGRVARTAASLVALPARALAVLDGTELLLARLVAVLDRAETLVERVGSVVVDAEEAVRQVRVLTTTTALAVEEVVRVSSAAAAVVTDAELVAGQAATVVGRAELTAAAAGDLLAAYEPALLRAAPMAHRFVGQLTQEEITAVIRLIDELPKLTHHLTTNVLPILGTLDRVGPDIHELLEVTRDLRLAIAGIPGLSMLRRRGEDRLGE